jgi:predicted nucleotidyltransferase
MVQNWYDLTSEILLLLLRGEAHLRSIAKQLNASHSTVLRTLNYLLKEKVLDFRVEGKNKIFFIKKGLPAKLSAFNAERYKLMKLLKNYKELEVIVNELLKKSSARIIILFGSYAKFIAKPDSDIDIYVATLDPKVKNALTSVHSKLSIKIGPLDTNSLLIQEIIKNHIILRGVEEFYDKIRFFD